MNRSQLEHIIRAASAISGDDEIVVICSQSIHAQIRNPPPIAFVSEEARVYPRNFPERADAIDGAIGELSRFHETFGYYAHGVTPATADLGLALLAGREVGCVAEPDLGALATKSSQALSRRVSSRRTLVWIIQ